MFLKATCTNRYISSIPNKYFIPPYAPWLSATINHWIDSLAIFKLLSRPIAINILLTVHTPAYTAKGCLHRTGEEEKPELSPTSFAFFPSELWVSRAMDHSFCGSNWNTNSHHASITCSGGIRRTWRFQHCTAFHHLFQCPDLWGQCWLFDRSNLGQ